MRTNLVMTLLLTLFTKQNDLVIFASKMIQKDLRCVDITSTSFIPDLTFHSVFVYMVPVQVMSHNAGMTNGTVVM